MRYTVTIDVTGPEDVDSFEDELNGFIQDRLDGEQLWISDPDHEDADRDGDVEFRIEYVDVTTAAD